LEFGSHHHQGKSLQSLNCPGGSSVSSNSFRFQSVLTSRHHLVSEPRIHISDFFSLITTDVLFSCVTDTLLFPISQIVIDRMFRAPLRECIPCILWWDFHSFSLFLFVIDIREAREPFSRNECHAKQSENLLCVFTRLSRWVNVSRIYFVIPGKDWVYYSVHQIRLRLPFQVTEICCRTVSHSSNVLSTQLNR
jgi:hypothetical protein